MKRIILLLIIIAVIGLVAGYLIFARTSCEADFMISTTVCRICVYGRKAWFHIPTACPIRLFALLGLRPADFIFAPILRASPGPSHKGSPQLSRYWA